MSRKRRKTKFDDAMGPEPTWDSEPENIVLLEAFNWYNYHYNADQGMKWLKEYLESIDYARLSHIRRIPTWKIPTSMFWISKLLLRGLAVPSEWMNKFNAKLTELEAIEVKEPEKPKVDRPRPSVQDHMRELSHELIGELEEEIDRFTVNGYKSDFDPYTWFTAKEIGAPLVTKIVNFYIPELEEIETALSRKDPDLNEAYTMSRNDMKAYRDWIQKIVDSGNRYKANKLKMRKPRKPKVKKAEQLVSKVKYLKEYPELQLVSVPPEKVVGASELWVYNVKYRTVGVYVAEAANDLSMKGTTVQNYDPAKSVQKKVRKPEDLFSKMAGKRACRSTFDSLTTKPSGLRGRIDGNTILLKAF